MANQNRAGEVIAVGLDGAQTQLTAHWTGTFPAVMDSVTVEVGP